MQANFKFDLVLQEMKHYTLFFVWLLTAVCYGLESAGLKLGVDNYFLKEGSRTKLYKSSNLTALIKINYKRVLLVSVSERRELRIFETSLRRDGRIKKKTIQPGEDC